MNPSTLMAASLLAILPIQVVAAALPRCQAKQLDIRLLAVDEPGMSKENWLFGVLNRGEKNCLLTVETPQLSWKGAGSRPIPSRRSRPGRNRLVLAAIGRAAQAKASQIAWFSARLSKDAVAGGPWRLSIRLAGLGRAPFTMAPPDPSPRTLRTVTPLTAASRHWLDGVIAGDRCVGWQGGDWTVNLERTVNCG